MLQNAYLHAKIGADTAENEQHLPKFCQPTLSDVSYLASAPEVRPPARVSVARVPGAGLRDPLPLMTPVIILGGILGGVFTPTEASAVAVAYSLVISLFVLKSMVIRDLPKVLTEAAMTSSVVLLLVGAAMAFKTVVSLSHTPEILAEWILTLSENPLILLFLINLLLFLVGMFLDAGPAIIILAPILGPIFINLGVHPVHFAIIMSVNLTVGLATPPMGLVLFVASSVSGERIESISKAILPFLAIEVVVIFMITYIPAVSLAIPRYFGFIIGG